MRAFRLSSRLLVTLSLALIAVGALALHPHAASAVTITNSDLGSAFSSNTSGAGTNNYLSWSKFLGFVYYVGVPLIAGIGTIVVINRLKDNHDMAHIIGNAMLEAAILGIATFLFALPSQLSAQNLSNGSGALLAPSASYAKPFPDTRSARHR